MESENGELRIEILALSPMSRCGLPRPAMAFLLQMPTSGTLFMVYYNYVEDFIVTVNQVGACFRFVLSDDKC